MSDNNPFRDFDEVLELEAKSIEKTIKGRKFRFHSSASIAFRQKFWGNVEKVKGDQDRILDIEIADALFAESLNDKDITFLKQHLGPGAYLTLAITVLQLQGVVPTEADIKLMEKEGAGPNRQARRKVKRKTVTPRKPSSKSGSARSTQTGNGSIPATSSRT